MTLLITLHMGVFRLYELAERSIGAEAIRNAATRRHSQSTLRSGQAMLRPSSAGPWTFRAPLRRPWSASAPPAKRLFSESERFNGRISDLVNRSRFASAADLDDTLNQYMTTHINHIPERALTHQSPIALISPLQIRTRPRRNVAPVVRVERGVTAQHVAA